MKRQVNIQQAKQHDKWPPKQAKEEIGSLLIIVKMIQNIENKMELQQTRDKDWEDERNVSQGQRRNKEESVNNE